MTAWQQSRERAALIAELFPLERWRHRRGDAGRNSEAAQPGTTVTQVILSQIRPGMEDAYREWSARIQQAQANIRDIAGCIFSRQHRTVAIGPRCCVSTRQSTGSMDRSSGTGRNAEGIQGVHRKRGTDAARDFISRLGAHQPADRKRTAELENGPARSARPLSDRRF